MTLLRAMDPAYSHRRRHHPAPSTQRTSSTSRRNAEHEPRRRSKARPIAVGDVIDPETGEVYLDSGETFTEDKLDKIIASTVTRSARS